MRDLDLAMEHCRRLGFAVRRYPPGGYGFASRDGVEIHLDVAADLGRRTSAAYLFVDDAGELAGQWRALSGSVRQGRFDREPGRAE